MCHPCHPCMNYSSDHWPCSPLKASTTTVCWPLHHTNHSSAVHFAFSFFNASTTAVPVLSTSVQLLQCINYIIIHLILWVLRQPCRCQSCRRTPHSLTHRQRSLNLTFGSASSPHWMARSMCASVVATESSSEMSSGTYWTRL